MNGDGELRLALAGCGRIAERGYLPAALETAGVRIVAFADPDVARVESCRELWEHSGGGTAEGFGGVEAMLAVAEVDALIVASPLATHVEVAAAAAAAGVPSLVEKPPAPDLAGAIRLAEIEPQPLLAFNRRFLQGEELRADVPAEGWIELELELRYRRGAWGAHEVRDEALLDAGIHLIDLAAFLARSAPIAVRGAQLGPERAELELELGRGRARIRCATDRRHRETVVVRDRAGRTAARSVLGGFGGRLSALRGAPHPLALSIGRQLAALRERFVGGSAGSDGAAAGNGAAALATARDGAVAMAVVEAARQSAELGGAEVTVAPIAEAT
jgi:predicted dehydrogenase